MYKQIVTHEDWEQQKKKKKEILKKKENELKETPVEREKTQSVSVTEGQTGGEKQESNREKEREKYG